MALLLLSSCQTAQPRVDAPGRVALPPWSAEDQKQAGILIKSRCGNPPVCPRDAVLERAALGYVNLRAQVRASEGLK